MTDQSPIREQLLNAIDATFCQSLGFGTPEGLLAAYEASRTQTVDQAALRETLRRVLAEADGFSYDSLEPHDYQKHVDAVLAAVLPATTNHDTNTSDWSALAERTGRLRKTTKELVDRTEELETKVTQLAADQAASLREAADRLPDADLPFVSPMGRKQTADWLRRVADETSATETEAQQQVDVEALARLLSDADVYVNHGDYPGWDDLAESGEQQYRQAARYLLKRLHIAERQPAAGARQDGAQPGGAE